MHHNASFFSVILDFVIDCFYSYISVLYDLFSINRNQPL